MAQASSNPAWHTFALRAASATALATATAIERLKGEGRMRVGVGSPAAAAMASMAGELHRVGEARGARLEGAAEETWEGQDVVDLVGEVAAAGAHDRSAGGVGFVGHDLGDGVGHRQDDRVAAHRTDVVGVEQVTAADTDEHVRTA